MARIGYWAAFKAPSLRISPVSPVTMRAGMSPALPEIIRGSTRMGRSKHQSGRLRTGFGLEPARWLGGLLAVALLLGLTQAASAQGAVRSVHGDWQIRCDTPPGAQGEQCALIQSVVAEDRSNAGLTVIVLKTADQKSKLMRVVAPLGVLLPSGLGLKLDNQDVGRAGFVRCLPNGCVAEVVMDDNLTKQMRTGTTATFIIFQTPEEGIGFPMALKGFGDGFDKLP
jgi:invasion protein IalB